jgi:hypothetical protein
MVLALGVGPPRADAAASLACLSASPSTLNFGSVTVGSSRTLTILIHNLCNRTVHILAAGMERGTDFRYGGPSSGAIPAGGAITVPVSFIPRTPGVHSDNLVARTDEGIVYRVPCTGIGVAPPPIPIRGKKCEDLNGNGQCDANEPGMPGVRITLLGPLPLPSIQTTQTATDGSFQFVVTTPGVYQVSETVPEGCEATRPVSVTIAVTAGVHPPPIFFANRCKFPPVTIHICKIWDRNRNGKWDPDEWGLPLWWILVTGPEGFHSLLVTNIFGCTEVTLEKRGQYIVEELPRPGWDPITPPRVPVTHPGPITEIIFFNDVDP